MQADMMAGTKFKLTTYAGSQVADDMPGFVDLTQYALITGNQCLACLGEPLV